MTVLAYILTPLLVLFSITSIVVALSAKIYNKIFGDGITGGLIGGLLVWFGIDLLWQLMTGGHTSILVYIASFLILSWHYSKVPDPLYGSELLAMHLVFFYNLIF